jgi:hypothetical protein
MTIVFISSKELRFTPDKHTDGNRYIISNPQDNFVSDDEETADIYICEEEHKKTLQ